MKAGYELSLIVGPQALQQNIRAREAQAADGTVKFPHKLSNALSKQVCRPKRVVRRLATSAAEVVGHG